MRTDPRIGAFLARLRAGLPISAAVAVVVEPSGTLRSASAGTMAPDDDDLPTATSRFDLGSLTKPIMATLALRLDAADRLRLDTRVGALASGAHPRLARRRLSTLLRHRAGFRPWTPLMLRCRDADEAVALLASGGGGQLLGAAPGTYSDLGFILWGSLAARALGQPLGALVETWVARPLGLEGLTASPGPRDDVVACRLDNRVEVRLAAEQGYALDLDRGTGRRGRGRRGPCRRGIVQDGNARFLGGLAGHAGLFGTASDLVELARAWLAADNAFLASDAVAAALGGRGPYALGWARRRVRGSAGPALSPSAFGHVGFTGGSLWIDPESDRAFVLLAHRLESSRDMNAWRRRFHRDCL